MAKKVFLSPSDQSNNAYAYGNTTEAVQCGRIAEATKTALERNGVQVEIGHMISMAEKCSRSNKFGADLHVPIHTNAFNGSVSGTRMFCYNTTGDGYKACKAIFNQLAPVTPGTSENIKANTELYEIRVPAAPSAYVEVDFHDVPSVAKWIIENTNAIGEAIAHGICDYFGITFKSAGSTTSAKTETTKASETSSSDNVTVTLPKLRKGSSGNYVKTAQILLNKYNNGGLTEDGGFGDATNTAVYVYQRSKNLDVDGVIGVQTWNELLNPTVINKKSIDEIAREVIAGNWGNGSDRKNRLVAAGYDYDKVQARVNQLL